MVEGAQSSPHERTLHTIWTGITNINNMEQSMCVRCVGGGQTEREVRGEYADCSFGCNCYALGYNENCIEHFSWMHCIWYAQRTYLLLLKITPKMVLLCWLLCSSDEIDIFVVSFSVLNSPVSKVNAMRTRIARKIPCKIKKRRNEEVWRYTKFSQIFNEEWIF